MRSIPGSVCPTESSVPLNPPQDTKSVSSIENVINEVEGTRGQN